MTNTENTANVVNELNDSRMMLLEANGRVLIAVVEARKAGISWANIGKCLDMSKQAAQQKFSKHVPIDDLPLSDEIFDPLFNTPQVASEPETATAVDATAPAKRSKWVDPFVPKARQHQQAIQDSYEGPARPGTGKGPHLCTGCGSTNHHGTERGIIEWNDGCQPTKYDDAEETEFLTHVYKGSKK